nr:hypothetical protein CFP56_67039 [Quercus suber]
MYMERREDGGWTEPAGVRLGDVLFGWMGHLPFGDLEMIQRTEFTVDSATDKIWTDPRESTSRDQTTTPLTLASNRQRLSLAVGGPAAATPGPLHDSLFPRVMIVRGSSSITPTSSSASSLRSIKPASVLAEDWDADDEANMSADDRTPTRPLSVAIPLSPGITHGPHCPRRPNLGEILANASSPPWTLTAFMAFLSQNHCLETLEFIMDAGRYRKHYQKMMSRSAGGNPPPKDREYVQALWQRLVDAYIRSNGSREVNLPSDVRDPIIRLQPSVLPPAPETLDRAVAKIYELMEESVLVPFLNSMCTQPTHAVVPPSSFNRSQESLASRSSVQPRKRSKFLPHSPTAGPCSPVFHETSSPNRHFAPGTLTSHVRFSTKLTPSTSSPVAPLSRLSGPAASNFDSDANLSASNSGSGLGMTDDSGSMGSPTTDGPMTPPTSPPLSDVSPKRDAGMWKKLGRLSGMKGGRKKSRNGLEEQ